jgi:hypothetical protein
MRARKHWSIGPRTQTSCRRSRRRVVCSSRTDGARFSAVARHEDTRWRGFATTPGNTLTHARVFAVTLKAPNARTFRLHSRFAARELTTKWAWLGAIDSMDRSRSSAAPFESSARGDRARVSHHPARGAVIAYFLRPSRTTGAGCRVEAMKRSLGQVSSDSSSEMQRIPSGIPTSGV